MTHLIIQPPNSPYDLVPCPQCEGEGHSKYVDEFIACSRCDGKGTVEAWTIDYEEALDHQQTISDARNLGNS